MALSERNAEIGTSVDGRQAARLSVASFSRDHDEPELNNHSGAINGQTKDDDTIQLGSWRDSNKLYDKLAHCARHDLALICPTLAENNSYVSVMSKASHVTSKAACFGQVIRVDEGTLNLKFRGRAIQSASDCRRANSRSVPLETAATIDSVRAGAKGEVDYHATV